MKDAFDLTELMPYLKVVSPKRSSFTPSGTADSTGGTAHICTSMTVGLNATWAQLNEMHHSLDFQEASAIIRQANGRIPLTHLGSMGESGQYQVLDALWRAAQAVKGKSKGNVCDPVAICY